MSRLAAPPIPLSPATTPTPVPTREGDAMTSPDRLSFLPLLLALFCLLGGSALADALADAQDATVFITVCQGTKYLGSGSGFVVQADETGLYIVTNQHVVAGERGAVDLRFTGVLRSGTPREQSLPLELVAFNPLYDFDNHPTYDLAMLRAKPIAQPPKPIRPPHMAWPRPKQKVAIIGFPLGKGLDLEDKNPVLTVSWAKVAEPCYGELGTVERIAMVGGAVPGNSGGPVVDSEGRLVGVLVEGILPTHELFIVPAEHVLDLYRGIYLTTKVALRDGYGMTNRVDVTIHSFDPFANAEEIRLVAMPKERITPKTDLGSFHRMAEKCFSTPVPVPSPGPQATFTATITLPAPGYHAVAWALQIRRKDKSIWLGTPRNLTLGAAPPVPLTADFAEADAFLQAAGATEGVEPTHSMDQDYAFGIGRIGASLLTEFPTKSAMKLTHVDLSFGPVGRPLWTDGGRAAYLLDAAGWVVKVALPSFEKTAACQVVRNTPTDFELPVPYRYFPGNIPQALVRSRDHLLVLSVLPTSDEEIAGTPAWQMAGKSLVREELDKDEWKVKPAWIQVIDPTTFRSLHVFATPGVVGLSAVPDSDRIVIRYFTGELGLLDPESGRVRPLCRTRQPAGLALPGEPTPMVLPVQSMDEAVLVSPGSHLLIRADGNVFALALQDDGTPVRPGPNTPVWKACSAIHYEPGTTMALLTSPGSHANDLSAARLVNLHDFRTIKLPAKRPSACLDMQSGSILEMTTKGGKPALARHALRGGESETHPWLLPMPGHAMADLGLDPEPLFAHPRGNAFWMQYERGHVFWIEFGTPWVKPNRSLPDEARKAILGEDKKSRKKGRGRDRTQGFLQTQPASDRRAAALDREVPRALAALHGGLRPAADERTGEPEPGWGHRA